MTIFTCVIGIAAKGYDIFEILGYQESETFEFYCTCGLRVHINV